MASFFIVVKIVSLSVLVMFRRRQMNVEPGVGKWVSYLNRERKLDSIVGSRPAIPSAPKGLYIYGNVGCGMLMPMDYALIVVSISVL